MRKKLVLIQFSRAIVPILVMLFHVSANMKGYWDYNVLGLASLPISGGVNYFFALSGFMLFYIYQEKLGQPSQLQSYLINRFIRIYPLYWILTCIAIPVLIFFPFLGLGNEINYDSIVHSFLLIPHPEGMEPILDIAWSLVYTIYFYIIFALLFLKNQVISKVILFVWTLVTLGFLTNIFWSEDSIFYFLFYEYNLIFIAGMFCAYLVKSTTLNLQLAITIAGVGFLIFPLTWLNEVHKIINLSFDVSTGLASALIIFGLASIDLQKDITLPRFFNYLGNASLSIYLAHNLPLNTFSHLFYKIGLFEKIGGVATTIILLVMITCVGCLVHSYIEKPLVKHLKSRF
ncbi:acyltransferase [Bacillus sp. AFS040349]|uniref:acyltransferase family protein n=1 Tax=Bacillus sp. AFS040349 TaxID=2033502 RepID=UPI000BFE6062|nr:acyltransferase [Bacillus sp. AFS040349]PGT88778.1 hypothetical protein COD11_05560 [Bacillus sp. AFS040349]